MYIQVGFVFQTECFQKSVLSLVLSLLCTGLWSSSTIAGGGMVLSSDACILEIDFYSAHFTAYQPDTSGNTQFCQELPETGPSIFVLDYLHDSLKDVPVDFRIIRNVTGQGAFVKLKHVEAIEGAGDDALGLTLLQDRVPDGYNVAGAGENLIAPFA